MNIMGTGSRSVVLLESKELKILKKKVIEKITKLLPVDNIISGMAEGWDELIASCAIEMNIPLVAAIPNEGYSDYYWKRNSLTKKDRSRDFNWYLERVSEVIYVCNSIYENGVHSNFIRNQWMVDHSDIALVYDTGSSGTKDAIKKLQACDRPYHIIQI